jgi:hypothetical protein
LACMVRLVQCHRGVNVLGQENVLRNGEANNETHLSQSMCLA